MSQVISWLGNAEYGVAGLRVREGNPVVFRPTDISGLQVWLDANDTDSVSANPFGTVESWHNKGDLSGNFDLSGNADVRYGQNYVNGLETVSFTDNAYMIGNYAMNFQDRTIFYVYRRNTDISGSVLTWITSDTTDGLESGVLQLSPTSFIYVLAQHPGSVVNLAFTDTIDRKGYAQLVDFSVSSTDLSGNYGGINSVEQPLSVSGLVSNYPTSTIPYFLGNYLNGTPLQNNVDMCEIIIYDTVVSPAQRALVEEYLMTKWAITEPPAPVPIPFAPTDLSGLQMWLDGSNVSSFSLSGSDVLSWSNVGSAGGSFAPGSNIAQYSNAIVAFPAETTLESYIQLPYLSRTFFTVFEVKSDLTTLAYPYVNLMNGNASNASQIGVNWDSNTSNYYVSVCQNGTNCPIVGSFAVLPTGLNLYYGVVDSNSSSNTFAYLNNSSNLNTSTDLGNLFNTNPIPYIIGTTSSNSPIFTMAEFIEYDSVLSSNDISTVKSYLSDKWGLGL